MDPNQYAYLFKIEQLEKEVIRLRKENEFLKEKLKNLSTDE
jgi:cell division protein FtsB